MNRLQHFGQRVRETFIENERINKAVAAISVTGMFASLITADIMIQSSSEQTFNNGLRVALGAAALGKVAFETVCGGSEFRHDQALQALPYGAVDNRGKI